MDVKLFFKRNSSTILTCMGAAGTVATAVLAVKATPKAIRLLDEAEEIKGEELTTIEKVEVAGPAYVPAVLVGLSTIACIFGANTLNKRQQASLISAYALLDSSYQEYRNKVKEIYGEDADKRVKEEIVKDYHREFEEDLPEGEALFFDYNAMSYFNASFDQVLQKVTMDDGLECYIIATPFNDGIGIREIF